MERYIRRPLTLLPIDSTEEVLLDPSSGETWRVPAGWSRIMHQCREWKSLEEHAAFLASLSPVTTQTHLTSLQEAVREKLLVPESEILQQARRSITESRPHSAPRTAVIPTKSRPQLVQRLLQGLSKEGMKGIEEILVVDGDPKSPSLVDCLRSTSERLQLPIRYLGLREKEEFLERSRVADPRLHHSLSFLLGEKFNFLPAYGAPRNLAILDTLGRVVLSLDDDIEAKGFSTKTDDLRISSTRHPQDKVFFESKEDLDRSTAGVPLDLHDPFSQFLGERLSDVHSLGLTNPALLSTLLSGKARVTVGVAGILGDTGWPSELPHLLMGCHAPGNLYRSRGALERHIRSRLIMRSSKELVVGIGPTFPSTAFLVDNSQSLPPFLPHGRGEDTLFGLCLTNLMSHRLFMYLPWTVSHVPVPSRQGDPVRPWGDGLEMNIMTLLMKILETEASSEETAGMHSLRTFGVKIQDFSTWDETSFLERLEHFHRLNLYSLKRVASLVRDEFLKAPPFWRRWIEQFLTELEVKLESENLGMPSEFRAGSLKPSPSEGCRAFLANFGEALGDWEEIRDFTTDTLGETGRISSLVP